MLFNLSSYYNVESFADEFLEWVEIMQSTATRAATATFDEIDVIDFFAQDILNTDDLILIAGCRDWVLGCMIDSCINWSENEAYRLVNMFKAEVDYVASVNEINDVAFYISLA